LSNVVPTSIPYPAIGRHGVIGDRRTAALVAADGTIDWLCLPDYDGQPVFGALLDARAGGAWRLGPARLVQGRQSYDGDTAVLTTAWELESGRLELTDTMLWPEDDRPAGRVDGRAVLRRLRCVTGQAACVWALEPRPDGAPEIHTWTSGPIGTVPGAPPRGVERFTLHAGEELWAVLGPDDANGWTVERCRAALEETATFWRQLAARLQWNGPGAPQARRAGITIHLLSYAPDGSVVAAPTTSLPERIGGSWNADYRLSWVRDSALSLGALASLGDVENAGRYLDWLGRRAAGGVPQRPLYSLREDRGTPTQHDGALAGYRGSAPVRFGNHAYDQRQIGSLGFLADCVLVYLRHGGDWGEVHWDMLRRAADHVADTWREPDNGVWELKTRQRYVSSQVMCWTALDRAARVAQRLGRDAPVDRWRAAMDDIAADVLSHGWSDRLGAFRQCHEAEGLDASSLLIPIMGMLPFDDPRVVRTVDRIVERLTIDGLVYRFDPDEVPAIDDARPMGQYEGAFLPCTFWLATVLAAMGRRDAARDLLARVDTVVGPTGLLAEGVDPRDGTFLGNMPLLFSHAEQLRALRALAGGAALPAQPDGGSGGPT
jgi:GH15 family glucan-1,4-alpha-glucosidase